MADSSDAYCTYVKFTETEITVTLNTGRLIQCKAQPGNKLFAEVKTELPRSTEPYIYNDWKGMIPILRNAYYVGIHAETSTKVMFDKQTQHGLLTIILTCTEGPKFVPKMSMADHVTVATNLPRGTNLSHYTLTDTSVTVSAVSSMYIGGRPQQAKLTVDEHFKPAITVYTKDHRIMNPMVFPTDAIIEYVTYQDADVKFINIFTKCGLKIALQAFQTNIPRTDSRNPTIPKFVEVAP